MSVLFTFIISVTSGHCNYSPRVLNLTKPLLSCKIINSKFLVRSHKDYCLTILHCSYSTSYMVNRFEAVIHCVLCRTNKGATLVLGAAYYRRRNPVHSQTV